MYRRELQRGSPRRRVVSLSLATVPSNSVYSAATPAPQPLNTISRVSNRTRTRRSLSSLPTRPSCTSTRRTVSQQYCNIIIIVILYLSNPPTKPPPLQHSTAVPQDRVFHRRGSHSIITQLYTVLFAVLPDCFFLKVLITKGYAMMSIGEELKSTMPSFMQFCSRVDQGNVQEDWWTAGSDAEAFAHSQKEEWLSDSDSQNTIICSTTSSSPGPSSLLSTSTGGGQKAGSSKAKQGGRSKDTPAGQKPAQVVARRNARERRRVQAVNWAFARLRKVVPLEENKSKRMSKVKTLQMAIEYINQLQGVLSLQSPLHNNHPEPEHHQLLTTADINLFSDIQYKIEPGELQFRMPPNFYTQLLTDHQN